jgi:DNA-binding GntR family transcriptional regulator
MESKIGPALSAESLTEKVFAWLTEAIEKGELAPGTRIREATLARRLGISRGPLREALRRLEGRKLVQHSQNFGVSVRPLSLKDIIEVFEVRESLEGTACRLATHAMSSAEIESLFELLRKHRAQIQRHKGEAYFQRAGDLDFHYRIAKGSGNKRLAELLCDELYYPVRIHRYRSSARPGRAFKALEEHESIVKAMRDGDADLAEVLMRAHIRRVTNGLRQDLENTEREAS